MNKLRDILEDVAIYIGGTIIVLLMCVLYVFCRLLGIRLEDEF